MAHLAVSKHTPCCGADEESTALGNYERKERAERVTTRPLSPFIHPYKLAGHPVCAGAELRSGDKCIVPEGPYSLELETFLY